MARSHRRGRWLPLSAFLVLGLIALAAAGATGSVLAQDEGEDATPPADEGADESAGAARNLAPQEVPHLAHIHAGSCDELGIVVYSLAGLRGYEAETETAGSPRRASVLVGTADVELTDLFDEPFSIHVHESVANKQVYVACAEVGGQPDEPWQPADGLALQLLEQDESGSAGIASLQPAPDGGTAVSLFLAEPSAAEEEEVEARPTPPPGTTYTSPSFDYTLTYNRTWEVTEDVSTGGRDRLVLYNGTSYVTFTAAEGYGGDPDRCVDDFVATLTADPNVSDLELVSEGGTAATGAFAVYNHTYAFPNRSEDYTLFVGCIPLVPDEAVLAVVQNVPTAEYNDQTEPREGLLRGLTLPQ